MKILAGFYRPAAGELLLDGSPWRERYEYYRSLITAIFPDFHLFQRHGIPDPDPPSRRQAHRVQAEAKASQPWRVPDHRPVRRTAPAARHRRPARKAAAAMLDEWAADQDPEFRRNSTEFCLRCTAPASPWWRSPHDDRRIDEMDVPMRRLRMDEGVSLS
jgi:ABC-type siderophore export system fused ATPase/permease subunit